MRKKISSSCIKGQKKISEIGQDWYKNAEFYASFKITNLA
jgi:hypothetical protein